MPSSGLDSPFANAYEDDRAHRRDVACTTGGLLTGAALGVVVGVVAGPGAGVLLAVGALTGGIVGRLVALRISADDWDPRASAQPYVGASSPDDDIGSG